jgi:hypothetical protein
MRNLFYLLAVFISFPLARAAAAVAAADFSAAAARPHPTPPPFFGGGKYQKRKSPVASGMAFEHGCVGVGVMGVGVVAACW